MLWIEQLLTAYPLLMAKQLLSHYSFYLLYAGVERLIARLPSRRPVRFSPLLR
jgi:hypothetical protein